MEGQSSCPDRGLYRIIGSIYEEKEKVNRLKVIKATPLTDGNTTTYYWDSGGYNTWATITSGTYSNNLESGASLMKLLNSGDWWNGTNTYANYSLTAKTKDIINISRYYLGGASYSDILTTSMYEHERGIKRHDTSRPLYWDGYVGLMYASDYGYAAGNYCVSGTNMNSYESNCKTKDWLNDSNDQLLLTPSSDGPREVFSIDSSGPVVVFIKNNHFARPVFYLNSSASINDGEGSSTNPYILS